MIILDYSQIALSNILPFQNDIKRQLQQLEKENP